MSFQDTPEEFVNHVKKIQNQVYIDKNVVVINVAYKYNIALDKCDTYEKILSWVFHLQEKTWMSPDVTRRFISLVCQHHNLKHPSEH